MCPVSVREGCLNPNSIPRCRAAGTATVLAQAGARSRFLAHEGIGHNFGAGQRPSPTLADNVMHSCDGGGCLTNSNPAVKLLGRRSRLLRTRDK